MFAEGALRALSVPRYAAQVQCCPAMARPTFSNIRNFQSAIGCEHCKTAILLSPSTFPDYFRGVQPSCACGKPTDLVAAVLRDIRRSSQPEMVLGVAGATSTQFSVEVVPEEVNEIYLADLGLSAPVTILSSYLSTCAVGADYFRPLLMPPAGDRYPHTRLADPIRFFPSPIPPTPKGNNLFGLNEAIVTWVEETVEENPWVRVIEAFTAYRGGDYPTAITRSQTAVEESVSRVTRRQLLRFAPAVDAGGLDLNSYDYRRRVLLPIVAATKAASSLEPRLNRWLSGLQGERNSLAHTGRPRNRLTSARVSEFLCATIATLEYCRFLDT